MFPAHTQFLQSLESGSCCDIWWCVDHCLPCLLPESLSVVFNSLWRLKLAAQLICCSILNWDTQLTAAVISKSHRNSIWDGRSATKASGQDGWPQVPARFHLEESWNDTERVARLLRPPGEGQQVRRQPPLGWVRGALHSGYEEPWSAVWGKTGF